MGKGLYTRTKRTKSVISSVKDLTLQNVEVNDLRHLPPAQRVWVEETQKALLLTSTLPEKIARNITMYFDEKPIFQAYFQICGRSYFTDIFFPRSFLVVEIDGSSHRFKKDHDRQRDADFRKIGIRTIRIKNKEVMTGRFLKALFRKIYR